MQNKPRSPDVASTWLLEAAKVGLCAADQVWTGGLTPERKSHRERDAPGAGLGEPWQR